MSELDLCAKPRFWVVRSGTSARYYDHFQNEEVIAIGHWDDALRFSDRDLYDAAEIDFESVSKNLERLYHDNKARGTSAYKQGNAFIKEMGVGDVIITISPDFVSVGRVASQAYVNRRQNIRSYMHRSECSYSIRRKIIWGVPQSKDSVPYVIQRAMQGPSTIISLDKYRDEVIHWLEPILITDDSVSLSLRINASHDIPTIALADIQRAIFQMEAVSLVALDDGKLEKLSTYQLEELVRVSRAGALLLSTTKQELMSPGVVWIQVPTREKKVAAAFVILCCFAFNVDADDKVTSAFSVEEIEVLKDVSKKISDENYLVEAQNSLELSLPPRSDITEDVHETPLDSIFPKIEYSNNTAL